LSRLFLRQLLNSIFRFLGNFLVSFLGNQLYVSRGRHIRVDATVGTVRSSAHLGSLVAVDVRDGDLVQLQTLSLGIGLAIQQQVEEGLGGLEGPADLVSGGLVSLAYGVSTNARGVFREGNRLLELQHVLEESLRLGELHALDGVSNLAAVLEVDAQVSSAGLGGLGDIIGFLAVSDHFSKI